MKIPDLPVMNEHDYRILDVSDTQNITHANQIAAQFMFLGYEISFVNDNRFVTVLVAVIKDDSIIYHCSTVEQAIMYVVDSKLKG